MTNRFHGNAFGDTQRAHEAQKKSVETAHKADLDAHDRLRARIVEAHRAVLLHEEAEFNREFAEHDAQIAASFLERAAPLIRSWIGEPTRAVSRALATLIDETHERARTALGCGLEASLLLVAWVEVRTDKPCGALSLLRSDPFCETLWQPISARGNVSQFEAALDALDAAIVRELRGPWHVNAQREHEWAALRVTATSQGGARRAKLAPTPKKVDAPREERNPPGASILTGA